MKPSRSVWAIALVLVLVGGGCGSGASAGADVSGAQQQQGYGATKQMVVDILHSPEGKTAVQEMLKDPTFKQQLAVSETDVSKAVEKTLESQKSQSFLSQQAKDPQFASTLAKSIQPELVQVNKQLMKDPEYQKDLGGAAKRQNSEKYAGPAANPGVSHANHENHERTRWTPPVSR